jgi:murein DD-endopeptidase MepM/ murein hydrolase activator NlpD
MPVKRILFIVSIVAVLGGAAAWYLAGKEPGPVLTLDKPGASIGRTFTVEFTATSPGGRMTSLEARLEQEGRAIPIVSYAAPADATLTQETPERVRIARAVPKADLASLRDGPARLVITATRPVLFGLRTAVTRLVHTVTARVTPPSIAVVSTGHRLQLGGAEVIVYRVTPPDVESGVKVGDRFYPGFAASGAIRTGDPALKLAFFALLHDQDVKTPMQLVARDPAGNTSTAEFEHRAVAKKVTRSRVTIDDGFLARVVPAVLKDTPGLALPASTPAERLEAFLAMNRDLRRSNADTLESLARESAPEMLWRPPFRRIGRSKTESAFTDQRIYIYKGREVDRQVHLGFDLASTKRAPVSAANTGRVLYAGALGIYGNCVVLDHGMGVQSLYAHLSSLDVEKGDRVTKGEPIGRSGMTGLAAGDHVHFSMLVAGRPVNPTEWWDPKWIRDRITRKLTEAPQGGKQ